MHDGHRTSPSVPDQPNDLSREFGGRVRELRERAGLTLEQFSQKSSVSRAMLSKVERGEKSPTIGIAKRISLALDTSLTVLTGSEESRRAVAVVRRNQRHVFRDAETGFERHLLSPPVVGSAIELLMHFLPAGASTGNLPPYASGTEKHVVVAEGELVVAIGDLDTNLAAGDALFFECDVEHAFENRSTTPCSYYLVISKRERLL